MNSNQWNTVPPTFQKSFAKSWIVATLIFEKGRYRAAVQAWRQLLDSKNEFQLTSEQERLVRSRIARAFYERAQLSLNERSSAKVRAPRLKYATMLLWPMYFPTDRLTPYGFWPIVPTMRRFPLLC